MPDTLLSQVTASAIVVYGIQLLKRSPYFPWLTAESKALARVLSGIGAMVSAIGVHTATEGNMDAGWHIAITIPPLLVVGHAAWDWLNQVALQQIVYDTTAAKVQVDVAPVRPVPVLVDVSGGKAA